ncbi:MAG TPA: M1 family metallopeptidase, partial [Candidatus Kapabacteria bacterium]
MKYAHYICTFFVAATGVFCSPVLRAQPEKGYDVHYYNATVRLDRAQDSLWGQVTMTATATTTIRQVLQYIKYLTIDSVFLNNVKTGITIGDTQSGEYFIGVPTFFSLIPEGSTFQITTYYHGHPLPEQYVPGGAPGWGGVTDADTMMFAMGVGFYAPYTGCTRHWLPCYDLPDDKADSVDLTFITPDNEVTASNGTLVSNTVTPGGTGERIMHWHESFPIATYLLTFVSGPFTEQEIPNHDSLPFEVYALQSDSVSAAKEMYERVDTILKFYDSLFAPYPFQKVGFAVTQFGSMEHQTMICLDPAAIAGNPLTDVSDNSTIAVHELSHQWWGDRVTCRTFDDAWLNEGFAHYCESLDLERLFGRAKYVARQHENIVAAKGSNLPLFGAPTVNHHNNNYPNSTIYQKGACVLGMLRQYLGDSVFFQTVRYYGNKHAYSTATSWDLWNDFDTATGKDLGWFFKPWVFGTGYPKDTIYWNATSTGATVSFHQVIDNDSTDYFRLYVPIKGSTKSGLIAYDTVMMDSTQTSTAIAHFGFQPDTLVFDPEGLLLWRVVKTFATAGVFSIQNSASGLML